MRWWNGVWALVMIQPSVVVAQENDGSSPSVLMTPEADPPSRAKETSPVRIAGVSGGMLDRDGGPGSPYGTFSLTRYSGHGYLRGALTVYRGTVQQIDAALPSTFYIGSIGAGGNWNDWVVDAFASYGRQDYGQVETLVGKRASEAGSGSPYYAAGLRVGRVFRPASRWYLTPTVGIQYTDTKSLRHRIDFATSQPEDFKLRETAVTGNAALRIDRALGAQGQHYVGLSLAHYETDNGLTSWYLEGPPGSENISPDPMADSWEEIGLSGTWQISRRLWLDSQAQRTFGAIAGDSTTFSFGIRLRM